ncbi:DUF5317 domain-containing protein [Bacillus luteolus]|uniref:DUF5317 domain-containing protein n=1 Tax=Litchfieldia luteola TaxID=682179 RepID=A0ABR9QF58_9BACI|nr:DUF5317 domain-containing protein [Cytobacillus luteolus]MBE4907130.1 DUF5317 domain-containing protein [Cytobacillus luteolus]MBP1943401.1 hypothetical protein [Cytobacillus luteolus]
MVYDGIIIALIVALIRGGKITNLSEMNMKMGWVFPILLLFQIIVFSLQNEIDWVGTYSNIAFIFVYIIGLFFLWMNRDLPGFFMIIVGVGLNFIVMLLNGGRMPVSPQAALALDPTYIDALKHSLYAKHELITSSTHLALLGDIIPLSAPYPKEQVISIGDIIMNVGVFIFIQKVLVKRR